MNTLKDIKVAENYIKRALCDPFAFRASSFKKRERDFYRGVDRFIDHNTSRARRFNTIKNGLILVSGALLMGAATHIVPVDILNQAELFNAALFSLALAGGTQAFKTAFDNNHQQATAIKSSVDEFRDDRYNYGLNNLAAIKVDTSQ